MARSGSSGVGSVLVGLVAFLALAVAGLAAYGPVTADGRSCGSLLAPGWSDDGTTGPLCAAAQTERRTWALGAGALGVVAAGALLVVRRRRGAGAGRVGRAWEDDPDRSSPARKPRQTP